jgi:hypothetical protein
MQPKEFFFSLAATATCADVPTTIWVTGPASARSSVTTFLLVLIMVSKCAYLSLSGLGLVHLLILSGYQTSRMLMEGLVSWGNVRS